MAGVLASVRVVAALAVALESGCATTWAISELAQGRPPLESGVERVAVPLPGATESLEGRLRLPISETGPPAAARSVPGASASSASVEELNLRCEVTQRGEEVEYRAATRYDGRWKLATAIFFLVEGGLSVWAYSAHSSKASDQVMTGLMAADAAVTGALFFLPTRDVYESKRYPRTLTVLEGCPAGLAVEANGRVVPVAADGTTGELGRVLLDEQMRGAAPPALRLRLGQSSADAPVSPGTRCAWARRTGNPWQASLCAAVRSDDEGLAIVNLALPFGTTTGAVSAATDLMAPAR